MFAGGDEEHLVVRFDDSTAFGDDGLAAAKDGRDPRIHARHMVAQFTQFVADQRSAVIGPHRHQLHPAVGEVQYLQRTQVLDQPLHIIDHHLLGADQHVDRQGLLRE